jgi:hypothetical protein
METDEHKNGKKRLALTLLAALLLLIGSVATVLAMTNDDDGAVVAKPLPSTPEVSVTTLAVAPPTETPEPQAVVEEPGEELATDGEPAPEPPAEGGEPDSPPTPIPAQPGPSGPQVAPGGGGGSGGPPSNPQPPLTPPQGNPEPGGNSDPQGNIVDPGRQNPQDNPEPGGSSNPQGNFVNPGQQNPSGREPQPGGRDPGPPPPDCTPSLTVSDRSLDFGTTATSLTIRLIAGRECDATLRFQIAAGDRWVTATPPSGGLGPGQAASVVVRIDREQLDRGTNNSRLHITSDAGAIDVGISAVGRGPTPTNTPGSFRLVIPTPTPTCRSSSIRC